MGLGYALSAIEYEQLQTDLSAFLAESEARTAVLCDPGGNVIVDGGSEVQALDLVSALVAASFMATRELASALGEKEFSILFHEGDNINIFITSVETEVLLLALFSDETNFGLVKMYASKTCRKLKGVFLEIMNRDTVDTNDPTQSFVISKGPLFSND
jgi:predicted regulator of Ras-like GTPase activity (Roadblock/LC7/MglB family)